MKRAILAATLCMTISSPAFSTTITSPELLSTDLNSSNGSFCYGYSTRMAEVYKDKRYKKMSEYYGEYFDRLQGQEYGRKSADIMLSYSELGQYVVDSKLPKKSNVRSSCEVIYDKFNKVN